jgi:hypothetical protein
MRILIQNSNHATFKEKENDDRNSYPSDAKQNKSILLLREIYLKRSGNRVKIKEGPVPWYKSFAKEKFDSHKTSATQKPIEMSGAKIHKPWYKEIFQKEGIDLPDETQRTQVLHPQEYVNLITYPKDTVGVSYFNGKGFFNDPVLDNVFMVGSGYMTCLQISVLNKVRSTIKEAYQKSFSFRKMVEIRHQLINDMGGPKAAIITFLVTSDKKQNEEINDGKFLHATTYLEPGVIVLNGDSIEHPHENGIHAFYQLNSVASRRKTIPSNEIILHEIVHSLAYTSDSERSSYIGFLRYAQATGKMKNVVFPVDHSPVFPEVIKNPTKDDFAIIPSGTIEGFSYDIYVSMPHILGENDGLVNTIMKEINRNYLPKLAYGPLQMFHGEPGKNNKLNESDMKVVLDYFIESDLKDGEFNYTFSNFDINKQEQIKIDAENLRRDISFPIGYL